MRRLTCMLLCFLVIMLCRSHKISQAEPPDSSELAFNYLKATMDTFHDTFDVYTDLGAAGNHFNAIGKMPDDSAAVDMDQCWTENTLSGSTCIQCTFLSSGNNWGGYYFLNGTLTGDETEPQPNWGTEPNAGFDLSGATTISFYARGETGGEKVEFFVGGVGWAVDWQGNSTVPEEPYPDSFPKIRTGIVTLTGDWQQYSIDLQSNDLSYVLSGFGWVAAAANNNNQNITFYLDQIQWDKSRPEELRLLVSYETNPTQEDFDVVMRNAAFSYDNALALLALLARGTEDDLDRASALADSFVHAIYHDRYYGGAWLRNAYMAGDLIQFPGWVPNGRENTARMPGFWNCDDDSWYEDGFQVSTHTGNVGWVIIALLSSYQVLEDIQYLQAAQELAEWVELNCKDNRGSGGYTGGYSGWEPNQETLLYKSTEHNLDLYAAFRRLFEVTSDEKWQQRAAHAETFVKSMWDPLEGKFYTGTDDSGITINQEVIPLDAQTWPILAFLDEQDLYLSALDYVEAHHRVGDGFDFNTDQDGIWYEGTAQMAAAYQAVGETQKAAVIVTAVENAQFASGAIPAASKDGLTTGFYLPPPVNSPWLYYQRGHVGASAWYLFAKLGVNPYWIGANPLLPSITVTSPNGGETYKLGSTRNITWETQCVSGELKIYLWKDGALVGTIAKNIDPAAGSYPWTVGQYEGGIASPGTGYTIKIKEMGVHLSDFSDAPFTICSLAVTSPNGGENWQSGSPNNITWNCQEISGNLKIYLWKDGALVGTIARNINPADGSYPWTVGQYEGGTASPGTGYTVKIKEMGETISDFSDAPFTISQSAWITVTSPNGNENWKSGSAQNITWTTQGVTNNLKIFLFKDGAVKDTIAKNIVPAPSGSYPWIVGQCEGGTVSVGTGYTIKVKEMGVHLSDFSDAPFTIFGITVTAPNGGESWPIGSIRDITWNTQGISGDLKIYLWKDGILVGTIVGDLNPASGSYTWTVGQYKGGTASAGTGYTIKVKEMGVTVADFSDAAFTLTN